VQRVALPAHSDCSARLNEVALCLTLFAQAAYETALSDGQALLQQVRVVFDAGYDPGIAGRDAWHDIHSVCMQFGDAQLVLDRSFRTAAGGAVGL